MKNESIADCIAILRMRAETTDSQTQIQNVTMALRQAMDAVDFPPSTIDSLVSNIDNCAHKDNTVIEFIKATLDHRAANYPPISMAAKALNPLITTFGNFEKLGHSARNFDITHRGDRKSEKWHAAKFLVIGAMTGHDLIWWYFAINRDVAA